MKLIDRDDFNALDPCFMARDLTYNEDGTQDPGPYLFCVNDTGAWLGRVVTYSPVYSTFRTGQIHVDTINRDKRWTGAAALWLKDEPINAITMVRRYTGIAKRLEKTPGKWVPWDEVYYWREASDLMWDGLAVHRKIARREHQGERQVRIK